MKGGRKVSLLDDLKNVNAATGPQCTVGIMLSALDPKESKAVLDVIDDPQSSLTALSRILHNYGFPINQKTLRRHRNRGNKSMDGCSCQ